MKSKSTDTSNFNKNIMRSVAGTAVLLLVPLLAMQFTDEVNWSLVDFVTAGVLLLGSGIIYALATRNMRSTERRVLIGVAVLAALMLIWAELAVGIFD